jgi:hypothetical protein
MSKEQKMGMTINFVSKTIYADSYIANQNDRTIQFYRNKDVLDYIPPIKVNADLLSDFGRKVLVDGNVD